MSVTENTNRIAKNTLILYFRQILITLVSLYTVRVVLDILGVQDYGIYNVVGGVVVLFTFLNNAMASATQRFLNYTLGQNDIEQARQIYSTSLIIHGCIAVLVIILAETIGLWFVKTYLNIPPERSKAVFWVYQFSVITTVVNIIRIPYYATIIAYERMSFFALCSIIEALLKFIIVFFVTISPVDVLVFYAFLVCIVAILVFLFYKVYCNKIFEIAHFKFCKNRKLIIDLVYFSGWSLLGGIANVSNSQGTNIVLNIFGGVTVNAAMGIATQVNSAVYQFVSNFQTAFNPQIIKSYAAKNQTYFIDLIFKTARMSFYLLFLIALPLYINAAFVLEIWLKNVPEYSVQFVRLILIWSLIDTISGPLWMSIQATGKIKGYQIIVSILIFANLPLSYIALKSGGNPAWVLIIRIVLNALTTIWRIFYLKNKILLPSVKFLFSVVFSSVLVAFLSGIIPVYLHGRYTGWTGFFVTCATSVICTVFFVYFLGLNKSERQKIHSFFYRKVFHGNK